MSEENDTRFLQVVVGLIEPAIGGQLEALTSSAALVRMFDGFNAAVISASRKPLEELELQLRKLIAVNRVNLRLVLVGGDERHRSLLARVQPRVTFLRAVEVFALGDDRQAWAGAGADLQSLTGRVLRDVAARQEPCEIDVTALRARLPAPTTAAQAMLEEQGGVIVGIERRIPYASMAIVTGYVAVFALEESWGGSTTVATLVHMGGWTPGALGAEPWRLLSSAWLHIGLVHLLVNGGAMLMLGSFLERVLGWRSLVVLYTASALGGALAMALFSGARLGAGASGAIWGLLGVAAALAWGKSGVIPSSVRPAFRRATLINGVYNLGVSFLPTIALSAHLGGGITGFGMALSGVAISTPQAGESQDRRLHRWALLAIAAHVVAVAVALLVGRPWSMS